MKLFENFELMESYTASNYDPNFTDLIFQDEEGNKLFFHNVPSPENWDGESDWTDDEEYLEEILKDIKPEIS